VEPREFIYFAMKDVLGPTLAWLLRYHSHPDHADVGRNLDARDRRVYLAKLHRPVFAATIKGSKSDLSPGRRANPGQVPRLVEGAVRAGFLILMKDAIDRATSQSSMAILIGYRRNDAAETPHAYRVGPTMGRPQ